MKNKCDLTFSYKAGYISIAPTHKANTALYDLNTVLNDLGLPMNEDKHTSRSKRLTYGLGFRHYQ